MKGDVVERRRPYSMIFAAGRYTFLHNSPQIGFGEFARPDARPFVAILPRFSDYFVWMGKNAADEKQKARKIENPAKNDVGKIGVHG
ncbi:MAG: hypothetical protein ACLU99_14815 [Alphaproteobacteria bacterium]